MIELQRAKLGLPPIASASGQASATSFQAIAGQAQPLAASKPQPQVAAASSAPRLTPQQAAAAAVYNQEKQLQTFLHRLQRREDEHASTVPSALSRRMLHRQGVGYLDDSVASVVSATADRFLATVLQQAVACRDQRLKGMEMAREEERHRRKHVLQHEADADDRKRRKLARQEARLKSNLEAVAAADRLKAAGILPNATTAMASPIRSRKKKKKGDNGDLSDDDEESYDSLEEEEDYYQDYYGNGNDADSDDEDENREMLTLRDLQRPLEAWDVHLTGKVGLGVVVGEASDVESDNEEEEEDVKMNGVSEHKNKEEEEDEAQPSPAGKKSPAPKGGAKEVATDKTNGTPSAKSKADSKAPSPSPKKP